MCVKLILAKDNVEDSVQRGVKVLLQCFEFVKYISRKVEKHRIRPAHTLVYLYGRRHVCVCVYLCMVKSYNIITYTHTHAHALKLYIRGITHQIKIALQVLFFLGVALPGVCVILVDFHTKQPDTGKVQQFERVY